MLKIEDKQGNEDDGLKGDEGKLDEEELNNITSFGQASSVQSLGTDSPSLFIFHKSVKDVNAEYQVLLTATPVKNDSL